MGRKAETDIIFVDDDIVAFDPAAPEKSLFVAVVLNALHDLNSSAREANVAKSYLLDPSEDYIFSFRCICNHLDVDYRDILRHAGLL